MNRSLAFAVIVAFSSLLGRAGLAEDAGSKAARDEQVRKEILDQAAKLRKESRKGDTGAFDQMIVADYAEFNPYFPFLVDPPKSVSVEVEKGFDAFDKLPPTDRSHRIDKIQVYGDVALLTSTAIAKGTQVTGGFMSQAKFLSVYVKMNGTWILVHSHDGRRIGPDGVPID